MRNWLRSRRHLLHLLAETRGALREAREENIAYGRDLLFAENALLEEEREHKVTSDLLEMVEAELARVKAKRVA